MRVMKGKEGKQTGLFVCLLLVFVELLSLLRIDWWTSAGKQLTSWLSACAVLIYAVIRIYGLCFRYGV